MGKIIILDENTSNKIAAGEVIERPASVVKELVENSIDANADNVTVEIKNGGISFIKVMDNGSGMEEDDVEIAFERHATSKIRNANDLESITTLGFRGEALASIAAVSTVELTTRVRGKAHGTFIRIQGGSVKDVKQTGCPVGTTFVIRDLFYNTPARYKFLKKDSTEAGYVSDIISRIALGNPKVSFRFINNGSDVMHTPGNNDLLSTIFSVYGKEIAKGVSGINYSDNKFKITGYAGKPEIARANRNHQSIYINGRYIKSKVITSAVDEAYKTFLMKNKFPFIVLCMEINPLLVDINVHPTKMEVRFSDEQDVFRAVFHAVNNALLNKTEINSVQLAKPQMDSFKLNQFKSADKSYSQQTLDFRNNYVKENPNKKEPEKKAGNTETYNKNSFIIRNNFLKEENNIYDGNKAEFGDTVNPKKEFAEPDKVKLEEVECLAADLEDESECTEEIHDTVKSRQRLFTDTRIIGQAFSTYILLQQGDDMLIIDQHAAHERIMYEGLRQKYLKNEPISQQLLSPLVVELTFQELKFLEEEKEFFEKIGFIYESFGNNSIIIRAVPVAGEGTSVKDTMLQVVDNVMTLKKSDRNDVWDEALYDIACKAAVKANRRLDEAEIKVILEKLEEMENPYNCPHGRPTVIKITKYEFEKLFKRIV